ncbi:hypothetical protein HanPSC8_Chr05g0223721 [Helianthus annuus]|nr:hypothetical protein HanPSC8_Chr05g0223721 [Helianthus annuus]
MVWRHPDAALNELEPFVSELDEGLLKALKGCPSRLRPFPKHLLVSTGVSVLWDKPNRDPMFMRGDQGIPTIPSTLFLEMLKLLRKMMLLLGRQKVGRFQEENMSMYRMLKVEAKKDKELTVVVGKKGKSEGKKVVVSVAGGSSERSGEGSLEGNAGEIYIPKWHVKVRDSFKSSAVCEDVLNNFSPPMVRGFISAMEDDMLISQIMLSACNLDAMLPKGVSRFRKRMHEYGEFSKKKDKTKASMAAMKKEIDGFTEKEKAWVTKVHELTSRHEVELNDLKKRMEVDRLQLKTDRETLNVQHKAFLEEREGLKAFLAQATN